jgi:hypothetical protein
MYSYNNKESIMLKIIKVIIGFTENSDLGRKVKKNAYNPENPAETIRLLEYHDREVLREHALKGWGGYDKTDVTIVWENGDEYKCAMILGMVTLLLIVFPPQALESITRRMEKQGKEVPAYIKTDYEARIAFLADKEITA